MLLIFFFFFFWLTMARGELEMVQVLVRHGDRAPSFTYPLDTSFDVSAHFPRGFSQLTPRGFEQARELGTFLRARYTSLASHFDRKRTLIRSSDKDRCIETAMGITQTLFPADIVPVHTYSHYKHDLLLKPNSVACRRVERIVASDKRRLVEVLNAEHRALFEMLSLRTGWSVDASNIADVFNVLHRKHANRVPLPEWAHHVMANVTELKRRLRTLEFDSDEKARLRTGYLLGQMADGMRTQDKKLVVYASHDATLTSMMYSLGISDHQLVPYTAALMMELHQLEGRKYVKILYRNSTNLPPHEMRLPGCSVLCPIATFDRIVSRRTISSKHEHDVVCQNRDILKPIPVVASSDLHSTPPSSLPDEDASFTLLTVGSLSIFDLFSHLKMKN